jgi:hypothetical protein
MKRMRQLKSQASRQPEMSWEGMDALSWLFLIGGVGFLVLVVVGWWMGWV